MKPELVQPPDAAPPALSLAAVRPPFRGCPYMPIKLKALIVRHALSQGDISRHVLQANGDPMSRTSLLQILNHSYFLKTTPEASIRAQIEDYLRTRGIPDDEIATCWQDDPEDPAANQHSPAPRPPRPRREPEPKEGHIEFDAPEVQMLTPAARRHFRLFADPFARDPEAPEDVFVGADQQYALESLFDAIRNARLFALVGESGSGKTTLIDLVKDRIAREHLPIRVLQPMLPDKGSLTGNAILQAIVHDLRPGEKLRASLEGRSRQAHQLLLETAEAGTANVLLFEEAHDLPIAALKSLKRFHEFKTGWKRLLSIVLVGQPELMQKLGTDGAVEAREVARRLEHITLLPLDGELEAYVGHRLARAGARTEDLFDPDAWPAIRDKLKGTVRRAGGIERVSMTYPLLVHNLLTKTLNVAAQDGIGRVDANVVRAC